LRQRSSGSEILAEKPSNGQMHRDSDAEIPRREAEDFISNLRLAQRNSRIRRMMGIGIPTSQSRMGM
jgi:hypothetical protein